MTRLRNVSTDHARRWYDYLGLSFRKESAAGVSQRRVGMSLIFCPDSRLHFMRAGRCLSVCCWNTRGSVRRVCTLWLREFKTIFCTNGLIMLIAWPKNASLSSICQGRIRKSKPLIDATLEGARLRLRPILKTSFAFIFALPLWFATAPGRRPPCPRLNVIGE